MHRIDSENEDITTGKRLFRTEAPFTLQNPEWNNSVQEEIASVVEDAGLELLDKDNDTRTQLLQAIKILTTSPYDYVVDSQTDFNALITRTGVNAYQFSSLYSRILFRKITGGYSFSSVLSGGDTWGDLSTNTCENLEFEQGAYINFGDNPGNLTVNTEGCLLKNVSIRGLGLAAAAVAESFKLAANHVTFDNCNCNTRYSSVAMVGFQGSTTDSHNQTSKYRECSVYDMQTSHANRVIQGFVDTKNKKNCTVYNLDNTGNIYYVNDPDIIYYRGRNLGNTAGSGATSDISNLNNTSIAVADATNNKLSKYFFDGTNWTLVGAQKAVTITTPAITTLNSTDVALIVPSGLNHYLRKYTFNGANWLSVGNDFDLSSPVSPNPAITYINSTTVAIVDEWDSWLRAYQFDGTDWSQYGSVYSLPGVSWPNLATLENTGIVFLDDALSALKILRFSSGSWSVVGTDLAVTGKDVTSLTELDNRRVAIADFNDDTIITYLFDGSSFTQDPYVWDQGALATTHLTKLTPTLLVMHNSGGPTVQAIIIDVASDPESSITI